MYLLRDQPLPGAPYILKRIITPTILPVILTHLPSLSLIQLYVDNLQYWILRLPLLCRMKNDYVPI